MFDYIVVVLNEDTEVRKLERFPPSEDILFNSTFVPVSESAWNDSAGNGLGTLFAIENVNNVLGKDIIKEVERGKSVLIVHTAGEGTRNILTRTCKNKALIEVPKLTILEGVIKQIQEFAIPSRIFVTWGDQFLLFDNSHIPEEIRKCALKTHVMLFGLKTNLTKEVASKYGIQIVRCEDKDKGKNEGCELLDFDDSRNYEIVKRKVERQRQDGRVRVMVNLGMFALSGVSARAMLEAFSDELKHRKGKFNSDELWQLWISTSPKDYNNHWLREKGEKIKEEVMRAEPLPLIKSFPLSKKTTWIDFGTNESYYEGIMRLLDRDATGKKLRELLDVDVLSAKIKNGCEVLNSLYENAKFEKGIVKNSVISNSTAKYAQLENASVINSKLNRIKGRKCVVYNVVDYADVEVEDCFLVDVFSPSKGRIRLKMRIGEEKSAKEKWWHSRLPENDFSLSEVAEMIKGVSEDEMEDMKKKFEDGLPESLVERPLKILPFVEEKPWGYELWCASPKNYCELRMKQKFTLDELTFLFREKILGIGKILEKFPLIVKIIKADENLSVQVHPDDAYARKLGDIFGKEEAWYVLEALKNVKIYLGLKDKDSMNKERFREAVKSEKFLSYLNAFDAHVGDIYHIPAGVIHALGAGIKVYEVSTTSERTFRVYDYGRGRKLHLEDAIEVLRFDAAGLGRNLKKKLSILRKETGCEQYRLLSSESFDLSFFKIHRSISVFTDGKLHVLTAIRGNIYLKSDFTELLLEEGSTVLVPACVEHFEMHSNGNGDVLCAILR